MQKRIAILTNNDTTWSLDIWDRAIPLLKEKYDLRGVYVFPEVLKGRRGAWVGLWYLNTFGFVSTAIFFLYALIKKFKIRNDHSHSWMDLSRRHAVSVLFGENPNGPDVARWLSEERIDCAFITLNQIIKADILKAVNVGIVNKHSGYLPHCRGVFPYFWARLYGHPVGVSFHQVDAGVDTGPVLSQWRYPRESDKSVSMLRFYIDVHEKFPQMALEALDRLCERHYAPSPKDSSGSYYGFPTRKDVRLFQKKGFSSARWSDLVYRSAVDVWSA